MLYYIIFYHIRLYNIILYYISSLLFLYKKLYYMLVKNSFYFSHFCLIRFSRSCLFTLHNLLLWNFQHFSLFLSLSVFLCSMFFKYSLFFPHFAYFSVLSKCYISRYFSVLFFSNFIFFQTLSTLTFYGLHFYDETIFRDYWWKMTWFSFLNFKFIISFHVWTQKIFQN